MGDCKDHATLLQSLAGRARDRKHAGADQCRRQLLHAEGAGGVGGQPRHQLRPGLDLTDSTAATVPFASLPDDGTKPVPLVSGHHDDAKNPGTADGQRPAKLQTRLSIPARWLGQGQPAAGIERSRLAVARARTVPQHAGGRCRQAGQALFPRQRPSETNGKLRFDDPKPMLEKFWIEADFDIERALPTLSGGLPMQPWFVSFAPVSGTVARNLGDEETPAGESGCGGI